MSMVLFPARDKDSVAGDWRRSESIAIAVAPPAESQGVCAREQEFEALRQAYVVRLGADRVHIV